MSSVIPTKSQRAVLDEPSLSALILAPAGCGKTEALALRIQGIIERGQSRPPKRILVVTFSNKARDNIQDRIVDRIGAVRARAFVTVQNLHGLSGRIYVAHSYLLDLDPLAILPEERWLPAQISKRSSRSSERKLIAAALRETKQLALSDDQVLEELARQHQLAAVEVEKQRQSENRLTYDDLPRHAEVILRNSMVAGFYKNHFSCVIVDEFQDLTLQQLRIIQFIGAGRTTYAGDLAQGIYSFTGASPEAVLGEIRGEVEKVITFTESHRSSPQVLAAVNSLSKFVGGQELTCARPDQWQGGGAVATQGFKTLDEEASWIVDIASRILSRFPAHRIGVITRIADRAAVIEAAMQRAELQVHRWKDPLYNLYVARKLKIVLGGLDGEAFHLAPDKPRYLWSVTEPLERQDLETHAQMQEAYEWVADLYSTGIPLPAIVDRIGTGDSDALLKAVGVHVLTAHAGKGQQFDWVIAVGLEQGTLPFALALDTKEHIVEELRVFSVMLSRARIAVIVTYREQVVKWGRAEVAAPSKFLNPLQTIPGILDGATFQGQLESGRFG